MLGYVLPQQGYDIVIEHLFGASSVRDPPDGGATALRSARATKPRRQRPAVERGLVMKPMKIRSRHLRKPMRGSVAGFSPAV